MNVNTSNASTRGWRGGGGCRSCDLLAIALKDCLFFILIFLCLSRLAHQLGGLLSRTKVFIASTLWLPGSDWLKCPTVIYVGILLAGWVFINPRGLDFGGILYFLLQEQYRTNGTPFLVAIFLVLTIRNWGSAHAWVIYFPLSTFRRAPLSSLLYVVEREHTSLGYILQNMPREPSGNR